MIHPDTELRLVDPQIGLGVFATAPLPQGTITYVADALEIQVPDDHPLLQHAVYAPVIEKFSYLDHRHVRIISWDAAKYVNHACECNTLSTGYGFEVAIRDIEPGEQITDDYGMFNLEWVLECCCDSPHCRGAIRAADFDRHAARWDRTVKQALSHLREVDQPLLGLLDTDTHHALMTYLNTGRRYRSVRRLKCERSVRASAGAGTA